MCVKANAEKQDKQASLWRRLAVRRILFPVSLPFPSLESHTYTHTHTRTQTDTRAHTQTRKHALIVTMQEMGSSAVSHRALTGLIQVFSSNT